MEGASDRGRQTLKAIGISILVASSDDGDTLPAVGSVGTEFGSIIAPIRG